MTASCVCPAFLSSLSASIVLTPRDPRRSDRSQAGLLWTVTQTRPCTNLEGATYTGYNGTGTHAPPQGLSRVQSEELFMPLQDQREWAGPSVSPEGGF